MKWEQFTKRTNDPKLKWIEGQLDKAGIRHRRNGESWHAPILEVDAEMVDKAWEILTPAIDEMPDDDEMFCKILADEIYEIYHGTDEKTVSIRVRCPVEIDGVLDDELFNIWIKCSYCGNTTNEQMKASKLEEIVCCHCGMKYVTFEDLED